MSNPDTPVTPTFSNGDNTMGRDSTQPSSPLTDADLHVKMANGNSSNVVKDNAGGQMGDVESVEDMDVKAKALMHLLNTSEVCWPIRDPSLSSYTKWLILFYT
jgi:ATP-dependent DNA helicase